MSAHAKLSPSAAERWMTCPGSVPLSIGMPDKTSAYAEEGTQAHELAERMLKHEAGAVTPDVDMFNNVLVYVKHIEELVATA